MIEQPKPEVCVQPNLDALCRAAAEAFVQLVNAAVNQRGRCFVALCGGRTGPAMYRVLAEPAFAKRVPWAALQVFWSDERFVAPDSEHSNFFVTKQALLDHVPLPGDHVHPMPTLLPSPGEAAEAYEEELMIYFSGLTPRFELMINGLGEDGHTASLFPHSPVLSEDFQARLVVPTQAPGEPRQRLSMTLPVFNNAENVWFLVSGADKAKALERAVTGPPDAAESPASAIRLENGTVTWWVDEAAFRG